MIFTLQKDKLFFSMLRRWHLDVNCKKILSDLLNFIELGMGCSHLLLAHLESTNSMNEGVQMIWEMFWQLYDN